ncbi:MAG: hypothetical protein QG673_1719 [Pseudomonadota bacterium]|nr:hypothetical protein [Pseudomonadota bacterium]
MSLNIVNYVDVCKLNTGIFSFDPTKQQLNVVDIEKMSLFTRRG